MKVWHYTVLDRLLMIVEDGEIRQATALVAPPEKPVTWFSREPVWEVTATKGIVDGGAVRDATFGEMIQSCGALARIEVDSLELRLMPWLKLVKAARIPKRMAKALEEFRGNPRDWFGTLRPVGMRHWKRIEISTEANPIRWRLWKPNLQPQAA